MSTRGKGPFEWTWQWKCLYEERYGQRCRIVEWDAALERSALTTIEEIEPGVFIDMTPPEPPWWLQSMLVEFEDGFVARTSWRGLRPIQHQRKPTLERA